MFTENVLGSSSFLSDDIGNIKFKSKALSVMVQCLFEGLTRKISSLNYLRFFYSNILKKVNIHIIDNEMQKLSKDKAANET